MLHQTFHLRLLTNSCFCSPPLLVLWQNSIPAAAGAVAAAAIADQMLGPKEHRHLAIVMVLHKLFKQHLLSLCYGL